MHCRATTCSCFMLVVLWKLSAPLNLLVCLSPCTVLPALTHFPFIPGHAVLVFLAWPNALCCPHQFLLSRQIISSFFFLYSLVFFRILSFFSSFFELTSQFLSLPPFVPFSLIFSSIPFLRFDSLLVLRIRLNAIIVYNAAQSPPPSPPLNSIIRS